MARIPVASPEQMSSETSQQLDELFEDWGERWGVIQTIANSPNLIKTFLPMHEQMQHSSLSDDDREVIDLYLAMDNGCHYCIPAHIYASRDLGLPDKEIAAIIERREPTDPRRRLVLKGLKALVESKGALSDQIYSELLKGGLSVENLLDIIGEIAHCTITNYTNRLAQTDIDDFLEKQAPLEK
ncbi:MAG: carboxymuconolactone decarboxylase family protein [Rhodospirillales bacterium]|jgi:AhpD family alkylhydroperoxidase|nr:carboxymuconolactone decarboxylase family protein [Rhodospirillales bacterium]